MARGFWGRGGSGWVCEGAGVGRVFSVARSAEAAVRAEAKAERLQVGGEIKCVVRVGRSCGGFL